jgi:uroporphyrinogen III methyltransferase/synthase
VDDIEAFDWVVWTSPNGVDHFVGALFEAGRDVRALHGAKLAAIGPATAEVAWAQGLRIDLMPERYVSGALARALIEAGIDGKRLLLARSDIAPKLLAETLAEAGADVVDVAAYRTALGRPVFDLSARIEASEVSWVTFTSSSTVTNFIDLLGAERVGELRSRFRVASIGPVTSSTARDLGLEPDVEAANATIPDLVEALVGAVRQDGE